MAFRFNMRTDQSGVAAVEFALLVPVLLLVLIGTIDLALYVHDKMKVEAAARSSAEYVIATGGEDEALMADVLAGYFDDNVDDTWQDSLDYDSTLVCECASDGAEIACEDSCDGDYKRRYFDVDVSLTHETLISYPGFPSTIVLGGNARMRLD